MTHLDPNLSRHCWQQPLARKLLTLTGIPRTVTQLKTSSYLGRLSCPVCQSTCGGRPRSRRRSHARWIPWWASAGSSSDAGGSPSRPRLSAPCLASPRAWTTSWLRPLMWLVFTSLSPPNLHTLLLVTFTFAHWFWTVFSRRSSRLFHCTCFGFPQTHLHLRRCCSDRWFY